MFRFRLIPRTDRQCFGPAGRLRGKGQQHQLHPQRAGPALRRTFFILGLFGIAFSIS